MGDGKKTVLFISSFNSARSQIAEALLNSIYGDYYEAFSAGLRPADIHPLAIKVMGEIGVDISKQQPKSIDEFSGIMIFDYVVTLSDEDFEGCPFFPGGKKYIHKNIDAAFQLEKDKEIYVADFRRLRDEIKKFIVTTFDPKVLDRVAAAPMKEVLEIRKKPVKYLDYLTKTTPSERVSAPFKRFMELESSGGILLISCIIAALLLSNTLGVFYKGLWEVEFALGIRGFEITKPLQLWINDGLMAMFFLVVGLEIKREFMVGELSSLKKASLPILAALGGMIFPIIIYYSMNAGGIGQKGWGIPMATDIAIVLGIVLILGRKIPSSLKVFITAFAIIDDIGAVVVIAVFYPSEFNLIGFVIIGVFIALLFLSNYLDAKNIVLYSVLGIGLWLGFQQSGIHATLAGLVLALAIPVKTSLDTRGFLDVTYATLEELEKSESVAKCSITDKDRDLAVNVIEKACDNVVPRMVRLEHIILPWVNYLIIPVFVLANTGLVLFDLDLGLVLTQPTTWGVVFGLVIGKQLGITLFSYLGVKTGLASLPEGLSWKHIYGAALLGGVGFTMSLFISHLAFDTELLLDSAKIGVLLASFIAGLIGYLYLKKVKF